MNATPTSVPADISSVPADTEAPCGPGKTRFRRRGARGMPAIDRAFAAALLAVLALDLLLVVSTAAIEGWVRATQVVTVLAFPFTLVWQGLLAVAVWSWVKGHRALAAMMGVAWLLVAVTCNDPLASRFIQAVEWPPPSSDALPAKPFAAVVVLGGGASVTHSGAAELSTDGQRIFQAAQLWHRGQTLAVICAGSSNIPGNAPRDTSAELLISVGVPAERIYRIEGINTQQEMKNARAFVDAPPAGFDRDKPLGLITSAFHMRRAMRLAEQQQLTFQPLPCCYRSAPLLKLQPRDLIPSASAAVNFETALKEQLAKLVGR